MKSCKEYRDQAANVLSGKITPVVVATLILTVISLYVSCNTNFYSSIFRRLSHTDMLFPVFMERFSWVMLGSLISLLLVVPLSYTYETLFLRVVRGEEYRNFTGLMFSNFNAKDYGRSLEVPFLTSVYVFLWMLLFIIPGIVKSYSYAMAFYISKDKPELSAEECIHESRIMMAGHKGKLFLLDLSYIGWMLLCILTCGILSLWVKPKMSAAHALFYEDLKASQSIEA
ncbi:MAG: DUF975 family protein [Bacteroidales bacterium]|nr:DUF975 family protein [Bacteroidales bacterium]